LGKRQVSRTKRSQRLRPIDFHFVTFWGEGEKRRGEGKLTTSLGNRGTAEKRVDAVGHDRAIFLHRPAQRLRREAELQKKNCC